MITVLKKLKSTQIQASIYTEANTDTHADTRIMPATQGNCINKAESLEANKKRTTPKSSSIYNALIVVKRLHCSDF
jgi:hypothetical protein